MKKLKLKIQIKIQGDELRVDGKKKDDLQEAMATIKTIDIGLPIDFVNFRDQLSNKLFIVFVAKRYKHPFNYLKIFIFPNIMNFSDLNIENKLKKSIEMAEFKVPKKLN